MDLSFFPLTLEAIDQAAAESLCLFIGEDERPLTGLAGLADWRLRGRLSRLLRAGGLTGAAGEAVLTPPGSRLGFPKLFVFGVGAAGQDEAALAERVAEGMRKVAQAGVQEAALQLPARLSAEIGIRALVEAPEAPARALVFGTEPQKLLAALSHAASRGQAQYERRVVKVAVPATKPVVQPPRRVSKPPLGPPEVPIAPVAPRSDPPAAEEQAAPAAAPAPQAPAAAVPADGRPAQQPLPLSADIPSAPPPPPASSSPPPAGPSLPPQKRPPPAPAQRYVPQEPSQNVFDKSKRKK